MNSIDWQSGFNQLNECQYLFVRRLSPLDEGGVSILITEGKPQPVISEPRSNPEWGHLFVGARPVQEDISCREFELLFDPRYIVSYTISNESYVKHPEAAENFEGKLFRLFSRSLLLEHTKTTTIASDEYPGKLLHLQVAAENLVVDVITIRFPLVSVGRWHDQT